LRAGPLSNPQVIELLNKYFVPATSANELQDGDRYRIYHEFAAKKLGIGDVFVYVCAPDGTGFRGLDVGRAMDAEKQIAFLKGVVNDLHTVPGPPVFPPHPQVKAPDVPPNAPAIHLVTRKTAGGKVWNEFPSENWITLSKQEWDQMLPAAGAKQGATWELPDAVSKKVAEWVYPQTEEKTRTNRNRVDEANFRFTLVTVKGALGRAKIDGHVRLRHSFYPSGPSEDYATSDLVGYIDFDMAERLVKRFRMVTSKAEYVKTPFEASLVSVSRETIEGQR